MSEGTQVISNDQRNTNLKSFFLNNKKSVITIILIILLFLFSYFFYIDYKDDKKLQISEQYNLAVIKYDSANPDSSIKEMIKIINLKDSTYSPLALYFLLDNNLLNNKDEINQYFEMLINEVNLDKQVLNLIIFKMGLYNSASANEQDILEILNPLINSENIWQSHALYILAEYFFAKNEETKSKEFFEKIIELKNSNPQIKLAAQKRFQRDLSE